MPAQRKLTAPQPPYEEVDHPQHYNSHPSGIECIDVVEGFDFLTGSAIKYLWRAGLKPGADELKDLEKAYWYLSRKIENVKRAGGD